MSTKTSGNAVRTEYQNDDVWIKPVLDLLSSIMIFRCINAIIGKLVMTNTGVSNVEKGSRIEQSEQMVKKCS